MTAKTQIDRFKKATENIKSYSKYAFMRPSIKHGDAIEPKSAEYIFHVFLLSVRLLEKLQTNLDKIF